MATVSYMTSRADTLVFMGAFVDPEDAYLSHLVRLEMDKGVTAREIATRATMHGFPISHAAVLNLKNGIAGAGDKLRKALRSYFALSAGDLEERASAWTAKQPPPAQTPDRYPARVKAIARAREDGRSDRAIQAVATFQGHDADALTVEAWSNLIASFEAAFAAGKLGTKKKP